MHGTGPILWDMRNSSSGVILENVLDIAGSLGIFSLNDMQPTWLCCDSTCAECSCVV